MGKLKLDLALVLPSEAGTCEACVDRVLAALRGQPGIDDVHVDVQEGTEPRLCVHFEAGAVPLERVKMLVEEAGAELAAQFEHLSLPIAGLRHARQAKLVEGVLAQLAGVLHVTVSFGTERVYVEFDPAITNRSALLAALDGAGVSVRSGAAAAVGIDPAAAGAGAPDLTARRARPSDRAGVEAGEGEAPAGTGPVRSSPAFDEGAHDGHARERDDECHAPPSRRAHEGPAHDGRAHGDRGPDGHAHGDHAHGDHAHGDHAHGDHAHEREADEGHGPEGHAPRGRVYGVHGHDGHGHDVHGHDGHGHDGHGHGHGAHHHGGPFGERSELVFSGACGALTFAGLILGALDVGRAVEVAAYVAAYVFGAWFTLQEVLVALRARRFEIDFLMLFAALGAAALGDWFEGALLLFLFTLGHALEGYAMRRARRALAEVGELVPKLALRVVEQGVEEVPVSRLRLGDRVRVKPNSRIPADGFVEDGEGPVNQAPVTGESMPVDKRPVADALAALDDPTSIAPAHRVYAGTINGSAALTIRVTRLAADSTLARVVKLVAEAETHRSPIQRFTDRFERVFVPVILAGVILLHFAWVVVDEPFSASFYRAMAVLVAASPCALAIATPSVVLSGVARAARGGVLIKGGAHLEALGLVSIVAFDKTGTLTDGRAVLTDVVTLAGVADEALLEAALAVESHSDHPLAAAVVAGCASRLPHAGQSTDSVRPSGARRTPVVHARTVRAAATLAGYGASAEVDGELVRVGKPAWFDGRPPELDAAVDELRAGGRTAIVVQRGPRYLGVLGVMDAPRSSASPVVSALRELGVSRTLLLTGDHQRVADAVARSVGVDEARGDLLPEDKVAAIAALVRAGHRVAMVGDGVNDAPAMAHASVGIAMGAGASDVALETADVALMADDLRTLPFAIGLSREARRVVVQNLWASLGMVAVLVPATLFGVAGIGSAVALHEGSTLLVVFNALRLLRYAPPRHG